MTNIHSDKVRNLWHKFFVYEENFLTWLNLNTYVIESLEYEQKLSYLTLQNERTKPPKGFRHVCYLINPEDQGELLNRISELKEKYLLPVIAEAEEESLSNDEIERLRERFPARFPEFYSDVKQINVSVTPAFSSNKIIAGELTEHKLLLKSYRATDINDFGHLLQHVESEKKKLTQFGFSSAKVYKKPNTGVLKLIVDAEELLKLAKVDDLQLRRHTGDQYRSRVFKKNGDVLTVRFGLMVLDEKTSFFQSLPQPKRKHALENAGVEFKLPISNCNFRVWIK